MKSLLPLSMLLLLAPACAGRTGDGDVFACTCDIAYVTPSSTGYEGSMDISLCETNSTKDHVAEAQQTCEALIAPSDTNEDMHQCTCSCVHTVEECYTK